MTVTLQDRYVLEQGRIVLTGVQALVRLPLVRARLDRAAGLNTAGFISGYRGSPLGTYDSQLLAARGLLEPAQIVVRPAVNEDLGATAVWGTQQVNLYPGGRHDGVFGIWYGKAPGVDRTGDVFKHANFAGTAPRGGVLAVAGDDHGAKSSSLPAQSEYAFMDAEIPVLAPSSVAEVLEFGVKAFDLSRFAGLWVGMTTVADLMDSAAAVDVSDSSLAIRTPTGVAFPRDGLSIRLPDTPLAQETRHRTWRLPAALAFVAANGFDRLVFDPPAARLGIVAAGKAYFNLMQALQDLGVDEREAGRLGLRLYKPGLVWPLEPEGARGFARGLSQVLVVEERRDLVEAQLKQLCYGLSAQERPEIVGKRDARGRPLLAEVGELDAAGIARVLVSWLPPALQSPRMHQHLARLERAPTPLTPLHERKPFFCSGCPHNTSTRVPEGSRAMAGIGCHYMVQTMPRSTSSFTQMGGEGVTWVGQAPFTDERHVFVNLGDGTYFHSGILAIRQAVAAGVNITYKILFNDAVAMTGGQAVDGELTVPILIRQLQAEGVAEVVVVSDDPDRTRQGGGIPEGLEVRPRTELDQVQRRLREAVGVTVLIYDQACATELRRRRKRGLAPDPGVRAFINARVCEGCGDCSKQSNCVSIEPLETAFGRKRQIDQSSCNQDLSCLQGFCPSFVTVEGGGRAKPPEAARLDESDLPDPVVAPVGREPWNAVLAGVGGQGVTSLSAILGMAAHLDGAAVKSVDMIGMAQKGGGVYVHLRIAASPEDLSGPRIGIGQTDLLLTNDQVAAHASEVLSRLSPDRTRAVLNVDLTPTASFTLDNQTTYKTAEMTARISAAARNLETLPASSLAKDALGDSIYSNMILLGFAWQRGWAPLSRASLEQAIRMNGASVAANLQAFALGRRAAIDPAAAGTPKAAPEGLDESVAALAADLHDYQDARYAAQFEAAIAEVSRAERKSYPGSTQLALAAAQSLHKLMAYKDEYEVARLFVGPEFKAQLKSVRGDGGRVFLHLAPPFIAPRDPTTGHPKKLRFGGWVLALMPALKRLRVLRGTPFDPFGRTAERRLERDLRDEYLALLPLVTAKIGARPLDELLALLSLPQGVRGFGHVKDAAVASYRTELELARAKLFESPVLTPRRVIARTPAEART